MLRSSMLFWGLVCTFLFCGCASSPPPPKLTGAMLVVRLVTKQEPTESVTVQVTQGEQSGAMASVRGILALRVGGRSVDYAFPVPLAPGWYKISSGSGLPSFELAFEVPAGAPVYIGRVLLSQDSAPVLEDRSGDDLPMIRNVVAQLRSVAISPLIGSLRPVRAPEVARALTSSSASEVVPAVANTSRGPAAKVDTLEVVPVTKALAGELPLSSRQAFKRYLKLGEPRTLAVEDGGAAYGVASGKDAIERAMQDCNKLSPKKPCRLFSVNQSATLLRGCVTPKSSFKGWLRLADVAPQDAGAAASAECPPRR
jgi:hypothetical protein